MCRSQEFVVAVFLMFTLTSCSSQAEPRRLVYHVEPEPVRTGLPARTFTETLRDGIIVTTIKTKLLVDPSVGGMSINVDSFRGVVSLRGMVDSDREAEQAVRLASTVSGVRDVRAEFTVPHQLR